MQYTETKTKTKNEQTNKKQKQKKKKTEILWGNPNYKVIQITSFVNNENLMSVVFKKKSLISSVAAQIFTVTDFSLLPLENDHRESEQSGREGLLRPSLELPKSPLKHMNEASFVKPNCKGRFSKVFTIENGLFLKAWAWINVQQSCEECVGGGS